jgi:hypothetical protein
MDVIFTAKEEEEGINLFIAFLAYNLIKSVVKRANNTSEVIDLRPKRNTKMTNHLHYEALIDIKRIGSFLECSSVAFGLVWIK